MNERARVVLAGSLALLLVACSGTGQRAGMRLPDADSDVARTFVSRCSVCHATPHPARHDFSGWQYLVPVMEQRMSERGITPLTGAERSAILAYLREHAR